MKDERRTKSVGQKARKKCWATLKTPSSTAHPPRTRPISSPGLSKRSRTPRPTQLASHLAVTRPQADRRAFNVAVTKRALMMLWWSQSCVRGLCPVTQQHACVKATQET